jgi:CDP-diglyceride synthetase
VFAAVLAAIGIGAYYELSRMTPLIGLGFRLSWPGYAVIVAGASLALLTQEPWGTALFAALTALLPILTIFRMPISAESFSSWIGTIGTGLYIGLAVFAAISMRQTAGELGTGWASDLGAWFTLNGESRALGMAWTIIAVAATWLSDTAALLVGKSLGRTPLIPHISPKKTLEGAVGGVLGAVITTSILVPVLGIPDVSMPLAIGVGVLIALVGICGDLMESFIKRCAGVKDSGTLIPGHGGVFDRVDALLPAFLMTWVVMLAINA